MRNGEQTPAWRQLAAARHAGPLVLVCFGVWLHAADGLVVATLMPAIVTDIGGAGLIAWTIALYEVGSIVAGAASALVATRFGLRTAMSSAAAIYMFGCVLSALAPEMIIMLAGRLTQGLGGGGMVALSFVAVSRLFPRPLMPLVLAAISTLWGTSAFLGPLIGGVFAELEIWRGAFWFFAIQAFMLAVWIFIAQTQLPPPDGSHEKPGTPIWRLLLLTASVVAIASAGIDVAPLRSGVLVLIGVGMFAAFLVLDGRCGSSRMLPVRPFDPTRPVGAGMVMIFLFSASTVAITLYGPLLITQYHGSSPLVAGYIIAMSSIGWSVMAVLVSRAHERHDGNLIAAGMCVIAVSIVGFVATVPSGSLWLIAVFAVLEGAGFGMAWTFVLRRLTALATDDERDRVSSALPTIQRLGYAIGAAYIGIVANSIGVSNRMDQQTAGTIGFWIFAACVPLAGAGLGSAWSFLRPKRRRSLGPTTDCDTAASRTMVGTC